MNHIANITEPNKAGQATIVAKLIGVDSWVSLRYYRGTPEGRRVVTTGHTGLCLPLPTHTKHTKHEEYVYTHIQIHMF